MLSSILTCYLCVATVVIDVARHHVMLPSIGFVNGRCVPARGHWANKKGTE
jgi:hypothetical protein